MSADEIRTALVDAHRRGDWELAKDLSQKKQWLRSRERFCVDCGVRISRKAMRCQMHKNANRYYRRALNENGPDEFRRFTPIEQEILNQRASGVPFKEIASDSNRSLKTVEYHWGQIKRRTGLQDVVAICRWAWIRGLGSA